MGKVHDLSILAGFLLALSGCHAGNGASDFAAVPRSESAASSAVAPADVAGPSSNAVDASARSNENGNDTRPLLVCFGDSLTAGLGTEPGQSYPDYLQADLDKLHYKYRVDNEGISGNTTKDGVERLPDILALHPAVVVVEFGGNDGLRGLRIEDTRTNLDRIVGSLKGAGIKVALAGITLPPDYGQDYIRQFDETYRLLAKKYRVPLLPFLLKNVYGAPGMMQEDHIHATAKGNAIVAQNVVPLVEPLLKK
jgi:acyl-CoA thioesterase-1